MSDDESDGDAPPPISQGEPAWLTFEMDVADLLASMDGSTVTHNKKRHGRSGRLRQMDALVEATVCGSHIEIAVEAKRYSKNVGIGVVDAFIGKCMDVQVDRGILYSHLGFDAGAVARARAAVHPKIELRTLPVPASATPSDDEIALSYARLEPWNVVLPQFLGVRGCPGEECWGEFVATEDWDGGTCDQCGLAVGVCRECDGSTRIESDEQNCDHCDSGAFTIERDRKSQVVTRVHWMAGFWDH